MEKVSDAIRKRLTGVKTGVAMEKGAVLEDALRAAAARWLR